MWICKKETGSSMTEWRQCCCCVCHCAVPHKIFIIWTSQSRHTVVGHGSERKKERKKVVHYQEGSGGNVEQRQAAGMHRVDRPPPNHPARQQTEHRMRGISPPTLNIDSYYTIHFFHISHYYKSILIQEYVNFYVERIVSE